MTLIRACDLALGYDGKTVAENINFTVNEGDYLCVIGENGSGKSTLIKTLLGLNKPVSGSLETALDLKKIGYLPQQTEVQRDFPATVGEIVMSGFAGKCGYRPFYSAAQRAEALLNMRKMGIESLVKRGYATLSGGQQQRALLCRALCAAESLLLLDEPTAGLDPIMSNNISRLIRKTQQQLQVTSVLVTHDMESAFYAADRIAMLYKGKIVALGTVEEIRNGHNQIVDAFVRGKEIREEAVQ